MDNESYFKIAADAISNARQSIWIVGWEFDPRTALWPTAGEGENEQIGALLKRVGDERPELDIRILIWDAALPVAAAKKFMPQRAKGWFGGSRVSLELDSSVPKGASHHQKLLIVDDSIAFCSSTDFTANRWDRPQHLDEDPERRTVSGEIHPPRHATTLLVSGPPARVAGDLARWRWERATGQPVIRAREEAAPAWPAAVEAQFESVAVGLSRTFPEYDGCSAIRENEALYLAAIGRARRLIYIENQYFSSSVLRRALVKRLEEPDGPEIVVVNGEHAPSTFDHMTMDPLRDWLVKELNDADRFGRFSIFAPHAPEGAAVLVHSKLMIVDDYFLRIGSANFADRSMGYDSECDLSIELEHDDPQRQAVHSILQRLIAHYVGVPQDSAAEAISASSSLAEAIAKLDQDEPRRLRPITPAEPAFPKSIVARYSLGDPRSASTAWRPCTRGPMS